MALEQGLAALLNPDRVADTRLGMARAHHPLATRVTRTTTGLITQEELEQLNQAVGQMTRDVNDKASAARQANAPNAGALSTFQNTRWTPFVMRWNAWYISHQSLASRLLVGDAPFHGFRQEYNTLRDEWTESLKQQTSAPAAKPTPSPVGGPGGTFPEWVPWVLIGGGILLSLGVLGYFLRSLPRGSSGGNGGNGGDRVIVLRDEPRRRDRDEREDEP